MYCIILRKLLLVLSACLLSVLLVVNKAEAQPAGWEDITPEGWTGDFLHIAKMSDGRLLTAASNGWIYESSDTAQSWHLLYKMPDKPQEGYAKFCMYEGEKGYLVTYKFVLYTDDRGKTWTEKEMPRPVGGLYGNRQDQNYLVNFKTKDTLFFCTATYRGTDVFMSGDGGKTWKIVIKEFIDQQNPTVAGFHWHTAAHGFMYAFGQWTETQDGGLTWGPAHKLGLWANRVYPLCSYPDGSALLSIYYWNEQIKMTFISEDGNPDSQRDISYNDTWMKQATFTGKYVITGDEGTGYANNTYISADSGKTWNTVPIGVKNEYYFEGAVSFGEDTAVLCGSGLSTIRTTDGGKTWDVSIFANGHDSNSMYCKNRNECFVLGHYGRLLKTDDGWKTWKAIDLIPQIDAEDRDPGLVSMCFPTPDTGYVSGLWFIFRTIDGGNTWEKFEQSTSGAFITFPTKDTGYVAYTNMYPDIDRTFDAGESWTGFAGNNGYEKKYRTELIFRNAREGLTSEIDKLMFTKDAGETWQTKDIDLSGLLLTAILATEDKWIIAGGSKVYSCDLDFNCELKYECSDTVYLHNLQKRGNNMYLTAQHYPLPYIDSVLVSEDGGESWKSTKDTLFGSVMFPDANIAYTTNYYSFESIYRRYYKSTIRMSVFERTDSVTHTIGFDSDGSGTGTLILRSKGGAELSSLALNVKSGTEYRLTLPEDIATGDGYYYEFVPSDTLVFDRLQSPAFSVETKSTGIGISTEDVQYRLVGNALFCQCESASLYDMLGRQVHGHLEDGISLLPGVYMLRCGTQQHIFAVH